MFSTWKSDVCFEAGPRGESFNVANIPGRYYHFGDHTGVISSYLHSGNSYANKMTSSYLYLIHYIVALYQDKNSHCWYNNDIYILLCTQWKFLCQECISDTSFALCLQLIRECKEVLQEAVLVKQYYLNMIAVATGDDPRQERAEAELETFEEDTKEMLEVGMEHVHNVIFCFAQHL